jgi:hypothetical protein
MRSYISEPLLAHRELDDYAATVDESRDAFDTASVLALGSPLIRRGATRTHHKVIQFASKTANFVWLVFLSLDRGTTYCSYASAFCRFLSIIRSWSKDKRELEYTLAMLFTVYAIALLLSSPVMCLLHLVCL